MFPVSSLPDHFLPDECRFVGEDFDSGQGVLVGSLYVPEPDSEPTHIDVGYPCACCGETVVELHVAIRTRSRQHALICKDCVGDGR